ncbi:hypothetical protein VKT23_008616 [Stygiomarasmius scandens]|uniref:Heterokaryon incompatibility domain-containing protein n=1 Tax=Marasmiellus scandens TaxID=2682957 RepID=A0ABR1JGX6_9AGAR
MSLAVSQQPKIFKLVFSKAVAELHNTTLDLTPCFTEKRYRFIDIHSFLHRHKLDIYESSTLSVGFPAHAIISYVWHGLTAECYQLEKDRFFRVFCGVHGDGSLREDGGPINLKVLEYVCLYASSPSGIRCQYLWLDRLCIMQTSKQDKAWQIGKMYDIYASCEQCIVLLGGLQRLASYHEETGSGWMDRAWTYQEAIANWQQTVLLSTDPYPVEKPSTDPVKAEQYHDAHWIIKNECYWEQLDAVFVGHDAESMPSLFLGNNPGACEMLSRVMEAITLNYLAVEGYASRDIMVDQASINQLVLMGVAMRTSSRPVDMVFSILGLLGVQDAFRDRITDFGKNERFRATLSLVEAMLYEVDGNMMADVPLWYSLVSVNEENQQPDGNALVHNLPTLNDLTQMLDQNQTELQLPNLTLKREMLLEWGYTFDPGREDLAIKAGGIASNIPVNC